MSLAALVVLSKMTDVSLASRDKTSALSQRRMKDFHDCSETRARKIFLDS